jgi:hypothetical protein
MENDVCQGLMMLEASFSPRLSRLGRTLSIEIFHLRKDPLCDFYICGLKPMPHAMIDEK